ncbi:DUF1957 domain-containing protein, partial [bacterium]|nr:DUF1957 domain-containing protein [bacterium]
DHIKEKDRSEYLEIRVDGEFYERFHMNDTPCREIGCRPEKIDVKFENGIDLFSITTNLKKSSINCSLDFTLVKSPTRLQFSTVINPIGGWRLRAELSLSFQMKRLWWNFFLKKFPKTNPSSITGQFQIYEDNKRVAEIRQFGFCTRIIPWFIEQIQLIEWKEKQRKQIREYRLQLQITSAHRELYRHVLLEKSFPPAAQEGIIGFSQEEIQEAEKNLFKINPYVSWDQSFVELVIWFKVDGYQWQEFQRDASQSLKWEFKPEDSARECRCEWVLFDLENRDNRLTVLKSGIEKRICWPGRVELRPFSAEKLLVWWDLEQKTIEKQIKTQWNVDLNEVGFFLKVHEEHLGNRTYRKDLECHLVELFSSHQNCYVNVEPGKCFSVEITARHYHHEIALTPVSCSIVTPIKPEQARGPGSGHRSLSRKWFHCSQREVHHLNGKDSHNKAKVLLHLHLHSPNMFRAEPFRESFLRPVTWPIRTSDGAEVHNTPGEWVFKNCLDSWLPLLRVFRKLARENVDYQVSLDISPPIAYVLTSPRFKDYMSRYLLRFQSYARGQIALMKSRWDNPDLIWAAERYLTDLEAIDTFYNHELGKDIAGAFRQLELQGFLELSTCTATHGMPAEMECLPDSLKAQIALAARSHHRIFGDRPRGIWLAENSFFPGVEHFLNAEALNYFFIEAEAVLCGSCQPTEKEYNPVVLPGSEIVAFGRSQLGRTQVWDAEIGYAGHPDFREYHFRHFGLPLKRITSKTSNDKQPYNPDNGESTARKLAQDFHNKLCDKAHELGHQAFRSTPLITCSYDAELFGHHWSEGPMFLEELLREFHRKNDIIGLITPSHYLVDQGQIPETMPNPSTWGHDALHVRWSDPKVAWTFKELSRADKLLNEYLRRRQSENFSDFQKKAVEQMAAELIRAQSSDLTFVIISGDFEEDMRREILKYLDYFYRLKHLIDNNKEDNEFLVFRRFENDMFPEIPDYYLYTPS